MKFSVLISFIWGLFIFDEKVRSMSQTLSGVIFLISGLVGMTYFSAPEPEIKPMVILDNDVEAVNFSESLLKRSDMENGNVSSPENTEESLSPTASNEKDTHIIIMGIKFRRYTLGLLGAATDGFFGGSALVPMHYSK